MVTSYRYILLFLGLILATAALAPRAHAQSATEIAITGVTIPGTSGNAFSAFDQPIINNVGQVAFLGFFPGGQGIFSVNGLPVNDLPNPTQNGFPPGVRTQFPGATFPNVPLLNSIWLTGNSDGSNSQGLFSAFTIDPPANPGGVTLNNTTASNGNQFGQMAITGQLNGNSLQGIYTSTTPSITNPLRIAVSNTPAPGTTSTYASFANAPALNDNNAIAFVASLANGNQALYLGQTNGAPAIVAQTGSAAPGASAASNNLFLSFTGPVSLVSIPNSGNNFLAFQAGIIDAVSGISSSGIFVASNTNGSLVAQTGTNAPVVSNIPTFSGVNYEYQNFVDPISLGVGSGGAGQGQAAFRANLILPNAPAGIINTAAGLFVAMNGGSAVAIGVTNAQIGAPLPSGYSTTFPFGATYNGFGGVSQSLDGQVAFMATLAQNGSVSGGAGGGGIFLSKNQSTSVTHIAVSGDIAPGTGGASYASFFNDVTSTFNPIFNDTSVAINDHLGTNGAHEVAFQAFLAGTGVNGGNNQGLFIANDQVLNPAVNANMTESELLARSGSLLTTNPGVQKTIAGFMGFPTRIGNGADAFNDLGQLVSEVDFTDNTHGVYVFAPDLHLSPFTITATSSPVAWGTPGTNPNPNWTFAYSPANQVYRVIIDPADVGLATVTVNGPTASQSVPLLQVSSNTGITHFVMSSVTLTLGGGAITSGINVLTVQGPSDITGTGTLKLLGDVTSLAASGTVNNAGSFTANVTPGFDLGNVPFPPTVPNFTTPPPSILDIDRFRSFTVARGNFLGAYPIDLLLSGNITSPSETVTLSDITGSTSTMATNDVHRGILKTGPGVLRLTGNNTFGPDTTITDDPYTTGVTINGQKVSFVQSIVVNGGLLSFANDGNLGLAPGGVVRTPPATTITVTNPYFGRWITLNGGGIGLMTTAVSTLANPTVLDANRGIALGPVTGFGGGSIDVFGTNVLDYEGIVSDNTDGTTIGIGSLTKTGAGTLILSGLANTYRGGTTVNQGSLLVPDDATLGAAVGPVTVNSLGTLTYTGTGIAANLAVSTSRSFTLNGGTLSVGSAFTAARPLTFNNAFVMGGNLAGPGVFATAVGGSTTFANTATLSSANLTLNGADMLVNFSQGGQLNVAAAAGPVTMSSLTNQGSGSITLGAASTVNVANFQSYGILTLNPAAVGSNLSTTMTNTGSSSMYFNGGSQTFIGTPATATSGGLPTFVAGIILQGQNIVVAGGLFVNNGYVSDFSSGTHGQIIVDYGALYKGAGFTGVNVVTQNGGRIQAGNSPGLASFGNFVFGPGGVNNYVFAIDDATGAAGPTPDALGHVSGWGLIKAVTQAGGASYSGDFTWTATPNSRLTVALDTLVNPTTVGTDVPGQMADFDPSQSYVWPAVRWSGTYSGPTNDATLIADTTFDTSGFLNPVTGTFGWNFDSANQTLSLTYSPSAVPEPGTLALVGLAALAGWRWRRRR